MSCGKSIKLKYKDLFESKYRKKIKNSELYIFDFGGREVCIAFGIKLIIAVIFFAYFFKQQGKYLENNKEVN